jgi:hypothetical protein
MIIGSCEVKAKVPVVVGSVTVFPPVTGNVVKVENLADVIAPLAICVPVIEFAVISLAVIEPSAIIPAVIC